MSKALWQECNGVKYVASLQETAWRVVEGQEFVATRKLVDSLEEQIILEELLEANKPELPKTAKPFHPLLYTPFRYPPLKYGSRFGAVIEPSLWYGSLKVETAFAEKAFYQLHFLRASAAEFNLVQLPLTIFSASVNTENGVYLNRAPFANYTDVISSPDSYQVSQALGAEMRQAGVQAVTYFSARSRGKELNIAVYTPQAFHNKHPNAASFQSWQCTATRDVVEFTQSSVLQSQSFQFHQAQFLVKGEMPFPAA